MTAKQRAAKLDRIERELKRAATAAGRAHELARAAGFKSYGAEGRIVSITARATDDADAGVREFASTRFAIEREAAGS